MDRYAYKPPPHPTEDEIELFRNEMLAFIPKFYELNLKPLAEDPPTSDEDKLHWERANCTIGAIKYNGHYFEYQYGGTSEKFWRGNNIQIVREFLHEARHIYRKLIEFDGKCPTPFFRNNVVDQETMQLVKKLKKSWGEIYNRLADPVDRLPEARHMLG